jgi:hypothetical protein
MSEMSKAQGPVGGHVDPNPTDDMVPPAAQPQQDPDSPQDRSDYDGSEDVGPQDYGAEDVGPQDYGREDTNESPDPAGVPLRGTGERGGEEGSPPAQSSSDPMPDIAGTD